VGVDSGVGMLEQAPRPEWAAADVRFLDDWELLGIMQTYAYTRG
jgi:hypothetical protein